MLLPGWQRGVFGRRLANINLQNFSTKLGFTNALERKIQELERRITSSSELESDGKELSRMLNGILDSQMSKGKSSVKPVESHFQQLFDGLSTLSSIEKPTSSLLRCDEEERVSRIGRDITSQEALLAAFDELYYHGQLSRHVASTIVRQPALTDVSRIVKLILSGGTGLFKWSLSDKLLFRLHLAHKLLTLKKKEQAKLLVVDSFESLWIPSIQAQTVSPSVVQNLGRALIAFNRSDLVVALTLNQFQVNQRDGRANSAKIYSQLTSVCLPLWQAATQMKRHELAKQIIVTCMENLCDLELQDVSQTGVLVINAFDVLYHELELESPTGVEDLNLSSFIIYHRREEKTAVQLVDIVSKLAAHHNRKLALHMLPMLEHYSKAHPSYDLLTARLRLVELNLKGSTPFMLSAITQA